MDGKKRTNTLSTFFFFLVQSKKLILDFNIAVGERLSFAIIILLIAPAENKILPLSSSVIFLEVTHQKITREREKKTAYMKIEHFYLTLFLVNAVHVLLKCKVYLIVTFFVKTLLINSPHPMFYNKVLL